MIKLKDVLSELELEEEYPQSFSFDEFNSITSFAGKIKYAAGHLKKLAAGSSRTVFLVDDDKVLKIAKNAKGLAQNNTEADWGIQQYDIAAKIYKYDEVGVGGDEDKVFWLEMELAKKLGVKRFQQITGVALKELDGYLTRFEKSRTGQGSIWSATISDERYEELHENEFVQDVVRLIGDYDMPVGDFGRMSSYGEVNRNGTPEVVMIDFGLTRQIHIDYYAR